MKFEDINNPTVEELMAYAEEDVRKFHHGVWPRNSENVRLPGSPTSKEWIIEYWIGDDQVKHLEVFLEGFVAMAIRIC